MSCIGRLWVDVVSDQTNSVEAVTETKSLHLSSSATELPGEGILLRLRRLSDTGTQCVTVSRWIFTAKLCSLALASANNSRLS